MLPSSTLIFVFAYEYDRACWLPRAHAQLRRYPTWPHPTSRPPRSCIVLRNCQASLRVEQRPRVSVMLVFLLFARDVLLVGCLYIRGNETCGVIIIVGIVRKQNPPDPHACIASDGSNPYDTGQRLVPALLRETMLLLQYYCVLPSMALATLKKMYILLP